MGCGDVNLSFLPIRVCNHHLGVGGEEPHHPTRRGRIWIQDSRPLYFSWVVTRSRVSCQVPYLKSAQTAPNPGERMESK